MFRSIALFVFPLILGACHGFGQYSPQKMVQSSIQRQFFQDNQYQFSGEIRVHATPSETIDDTFNGLDLIQHALNSFSIPVQGSVDLPAQKIEIIPEARYEHRNLLISAQLPLQFDLQEPSLSIDASAITTYADARLPDEQKIGHRLMYLTPPKDGPLHLLAKNIIQTFPKITDDYYSAIDSQAFQAAEIDDFGKEINAKYHVRLNLDNIQQQKAFNASLESLIDSIKQKSSFVDNPETYKTMAQWLSSLTKNLSLKHSSHLEEAPSKIIHTDLEQHYYFDSKGRLLGLRSNQQVPIWFPLLTNLFHDISFETWLKIRYQKPVFVLNSTPENRVDILQQPTFLNRQFK